MRGLAAAALAGGLAACSAQVDSDYPGEPMATLRGTVAAQAALESDTPLAAAIVWTTAGDPDNGFLPRYIGERVEVSDSFPASFSLDLFAPPPPEAEVGTISEYCIDDDSLSSDGAPCEGTSLPAGTPVGLWMGYLVAVDAELPEGEIERGDILGIDPDHVLVYYDQDKPASGTRPDDPDNASAKDWARSLQLTSVGYDEPLDAGYHVLTNNPAYRAVWREANECRWSQLCAHAVGDDAFQDFRDWEFQRCTEQFPDSPTCETAHPAFSDGESAESEACRERLSEARNECLASTGEAQFLPGGGLDVELDLQLGLGYWDAQ